MSDDRLHDFDRGSFTHDGSARTVFRRGAGPAVVILAEMPGITPRVLDFARRVSDIGCTAVVPHLFGIPGRDPNPSGHGIAASVAYAASSMVTACISREFVTMATGRTSPVIEWLRALARSEHARCGGPGVGAVGMCFTGGFALAMAADEVLLAPVLSQPSLPLAVTPQQRKAIDISQGDLDIVKARCRRGLTVLGLRFRGDRLVPAERFEFLREQLGDAFIAVEIDSTAANPAAALSPHSVLTEHLIDEPGQPTHDALEHVLSLLRERLLTPAES